MANPEHLKILNQGVSVWNRWRQKHPDIRPDLSMSASRMDLNLSDVDFSNVLLMGAHLDYARLNRAKLTGADLTKADLSKANLSLARLEGANLTEANLSQVNFSQADLNRVNFYYANLFEANLNRSSLTCANFNGANLRFADLNEAQIGWTIFGDNDFSTVKGLNTLRHRGPSSVGIDTIYRSKGEVSEEFLRGCGISDEFIAYTRSLAFVQNPIQFYSCFISYSSKDQNFAERLYADLQSKGVRCWFAPEDLKIGDKIRDRIDESIRLRDKLLLILTEHSIASDWVEHEVESALEEEKQRGRTILFPIRLDDVVMESSKAWAALIRRTRHIGDFIGWKEHDSYSKAFDILLRDLKAEE